MEDHVLELKEITKTFPGVKALDRMQFQLRRGSIHALIGENGAGKSTLIKALTGVYHADRGTIWLEGQAISPKNTAHAQQLGSGTAYQEVNLLPNMSVADNLFIGREPRRFGLLRRKEMEARATALMASYGFSLDVREPLNRFSVAMQQIVAICRAIDLSAKVLILDEPTASLDTQEVEMLFTLMRQLRDNGVSLIFVTHFLDQVYAVSDRITVLRLGEVVGTVNCADTDSQKLAGMMIGHELVTYQYEKKDCTDGEVAVALSHVDYHKESKHTGLNDMSLVVHRGEIVGIAGVDGNGQTQLTQLITGVIAPDSGTLELSGARLAIFDPHGFIKDGVSHVPEDRNLQGLIGDMSIAENLVLKTCATPAFSSGNGLLLKKKAINSYADEMVEKYDIRCTSVEQDVRSLSGGNQQKVILARELECDTVLLVAGHPPRGLDSGATSFIHDQMIAARDRGVGILLISADFDEILELSDRILVCFEGQIMGEYSGKNPPIEEISLAMTGK